MDAHLYMPALIYFLIVGTWSMSFSMVVGSPGSGFLLRSVYLLALRLIIYLRSISGRLIIPVRLSRNLRSMSTPCDLQLLFLKAKTLDTTLVRSSVGILL